MVPIYRFFKESTQSHFFTPDAAEAAVFADAAYIGAEKREELGKNRAQLHTLFALANLVRAKSALLAA